MRNAGGYNLTNILIGKLDQISKHPNKEKVDGFISDIRVTLDHYIKELKAMKPGPKRAKEVHRLIDKFVDEEFKKKPELKKQIPCGKGCSFCCHNRPFINEDEAKLLAKKARELGVQGKMEEQSIFQGRDEEWWSQPLEKSRCAFLSESGECMVYQDRPTVCRTYFVVNEPEKCSPESEEQVANQVFLLNSQVLASASLNLEKEGEKKDKRVGWLPNMVAKFL